MKRSSVRSIGIAICFCLAACLPALAQSGAPTTGKFGLTAKPSTAPTSGSPTTSSAPAGGTSNSGSAPAPATPSALVKTNPENVLSVQATLISQKQGTGKPAKIVVEKYQFQPMKQIDAATGMPNGKMSHSLSFTKRWDENSAFLMQALETNETLTSVTFEFIGQRGTPVYTVKLTNATVIAINQNVEMPATKAPAAPTEEVSLNFQKVDFLEGK